MALLLMLCTCNNTEGNKLVIFSGIALCYGDTYIVEENSETGQVFSVQVTFQDTHAKPLNV